MNTLQVRRKSMTNPTTYYGVWLAADVTAAIANGDPVFSKDNVFNGFATIWNILGVALAHSA